MGSVTSSIPAEPILAAAAVVGALGYGYVHYTRPAAQSDDAGTYSDASAGASTLHGQKKRGRKLQLPGDATLRNLDILNAPPVPSTSASGTRQRQRQQPPPQQQQQQPKQWEAPAAQSQDVVPGGFDGAVTSVDDAPDQPSQPPSRQSQQQQPQGSAGTTKKQKKKKGKKAAVAVPSDPSSASASSSGAGASPSAPVSTLAEVVPAPTGKSKKVSVSASATAADALGERWTRVEARKKASVPTQDGLDKLQMAAGATTDVTTSDAGVTTSATGNSSPVTERTTEDELPSELDESMMGVSATSLQGIPPRVVPVRPPPGAQPVKGFTWEDYEGVQVDEDASGEGEEDGGWGVVRSRRRPNKVVTEGGGTTTAESQLQLQTKKQRQNAQRREALKEAKREREAQQNAAFAEHKRELEHARAAEPAAAPKRTGSRYDSLA
ncbi:hypothetical protein BJV74DRAFT_884561 [Russula compacta]|nr:hypothetical protein BJV74DRAFT_884561 [Russula compacta]